MKHNRKIGGLKLTELKITSFVADPAKLMAGVRVLADTEPCSPKCAMTAWEGC